ncbi:MAG: thiamine phosphate synthase [Burkholderia sp.]|nr:MAG: Thiamine-phosphate synthase [Burkholderia gladioli]
MMSSRVSTPANFAELFWPPAEELAAVAERIRVRLGDWPAHAVSMRICIDAPEHLVAGDLLIVTAGDAEAKAAHAAGVIAAGGTLIAIDERHATLVNGVVRHALTASAQLADDWIAALIAFLDCGFELHDALVLALAWRDGDEAAAGDPWPVDSARFPSIAGAPEPPETAFAPCPERLGLYPVVPSAAWVERVLDYGARTVQLRLKGMPDGQLVDEIARAIAAGHRHPDARVFINDHWQLAIEAGAYGVHLGQEDLQTADLGAIAVAGLRLGLSSHGYYEMLVALRLRPSYLAMGPVYATTTKAVAAPPQGLMRIARYARLAGQHAPLVAIGGITGATLPAVIATGVGSVAVVSAVMAAANPRATVASLGACFES